MSGISQPASSRRLVWLGIALCVLGILLAVAQFSQGFLFVPWYVPALSLVGALLVLTAFVRRLSIGAGIALFLIVGLAAFECVMLGVLLRTPPYEGPARPGAPMPSFTTAYADGRTFTDKDLASGGTTVLTFFRGRW